MQNTLPIWHAFFRRKRAQPPAELSAYIESFLRVDALNGGDLPRLLPGTGALLLVPVSGSAIVVQRYAKPETEVLSEPFMLCNRHQVLELSTLEPIATRFYLIHFRPGRLRYFIDCQVTDLHDRITLASALWGNGVLSLAPSLLGVENVEQSTQLLTEFFTYHLHRRDESRFDVLLDVVHLSPEMRIAAMAEQSGLSMRQFERVFVATYGITPKYFARVSRLQKVARELALNLEASALECALNAGFFDQPHFINELQKLVDLTPSQLLKGVRERPHFYNPRAMQWSIGHMQNMLALHPQHRAAVMMREWLKQR